MPPQLRTLSAPKSPTAAATASPTPAHRAPASPALAPLDPRHFLFPLVEALSGRRPPKQLSATFTPRALTTVTAATPTHARLGRYRLCHVSPDAAELAGTLHMPTKVRAFAARVERQGSGWHCTEFHLLP